MKIRGNLSGLLMVVFAFTSFVFVSSVSAGSTNVTSDGIKFPDGTTQTTSASGPTGLWSSSTFDIYYKSGNVGIGTTKPGEQLEVGGNIAVTGTGNGIKFPDGTVQTTASTGGNELWSADGSKIYYKSGNVGIGTANPDEQLEVGGNIAVTGTGNGIKFPDGTVQTTASAPTWSQILPDAERFKLVLNDTAVLDKETGLVWAKIPSNVTSTWGNGCYRCYEFKTSYNAARRGWRPPAIWELATLVDGTRESPALPEGHPFTLSPDYHTFWSSTVDPTDANSAWVLEINTGTTLTILKSNEGYVGMWCVRSGD